MPLSTERLINTPLTGPELKEYTTQLLVDELQLRSVPESVLLRMRNAMVIAMEQDFLFKQGTAYPRIVIHLVVRSHWAGEACAFSIEPLFTMSNPLAPKHAVFVRSTAPPLKERGDEPEGAECFTLTAKAENPNCIRVHYHLPITISKRVEPAPGQMFPTFESETLNYDPSEVPEPEPPVVVDETVKFERLWGIERAEAMALVSSGVDSTPVPDDPIAGRESEPPQLSDVGQRILDALPPGFKTPKGWERNAPAPDRRPMRRGKRQH